MSANSLPPATLGNIENTRSEEQAQAMREFAGQGKCPFCTDTFDRDRIKVVFDLKYWRGWFNTFPYPGVNPHIVMAHKDHVTDILDITPEAAMEWFKLNQVFIGNYKLRGGGIVIRFGDNDLNGGSISHMHSHIQVPDKTTFNIAVFYKDPKLIEFLASLRK